MLGLHDEDSVELWFHNPDDFCERLKKTHPHEDGWPCCVAKNDVVFSPLAPPDDLTADTDLEESSSGLIQIRPLNGLATTRPSSCTF